MRRTFTLFKAAANTLANQSEPLLASPSGPSAAAVHAMRLRFTEASYQKWAAELAVEAKSPEKQSTVDREQKTIADALETSLKAAEANFRRSIY